jgi:hypothetical protein
VSIFLFMDEVKKEEPLSVLDRAESIAKRIEDGNKKAEELLKTQEALATKLILGGRSEAGSVQKIETKISDKEFAQKVAKGEINPFTEIR